MKSVESVVIVGAGSAGWLTALALSTYCPFLKIQLIKPRGGAAIGVGESTQGDFTQLLHAAGIDVGDFYQACEATLKCGIYYTDWNVIGKHYWHPFADVPLGPHQPNNAANFTVAHYYQQMINQDPSKFTHDLYYKTVHTSYDVCVEKKQVSPRAAIAFHVDALKLTEYLQSKLTSVEVLESDQVEIVSENGEVGSVQLDEGRVVKADLYVDCTGFNRAVYDRLSEPEFLHYEANVNRAVAAQVPYADPKKEPTPYTGAHAHEFGWTWAIPLQTRFGTGYVYHGDFCTQDQAETNFRRYWGEKRMRNVHIAHINFDSKTLRNPWKKNVVAIGLSAGFVEPLEATGLNWTITSASLLCRSIAAHFYDEDAIAKYNNNIRGYIYDVHDFIDVHYKLSSRRDSEFWKYQTSRQYSERLEHRLALYKREMPTSANICKTTPWAFHEVSWLDILNGYDFKFDKIKLDARQVAEAEKQLKDLASQPKRGAAPLDCRPPSRTARK